MQCKNLLTHLCAYLEQDAATHDCMLSKFDRPVVGHKQASMQPRSKAVEAPDGGAHRDQQRLCDGDDTRRGAASKMSRLVLL